MVEAKKDLRTVIQDAKDSAREQIQQRIVYDLNVVGPGGLSTYVDQHFSLIQLEYNKGFITLELLENVFNTITTNPDSPFYQYDIENLRTTFFKTRHPLQK